MVQGLGAPFHDKVLSLLGLMFQSGLTPELIDTLQVIVRCIPQQMTVVQERLLAETTKVLGGQENVSAHVPEYTHSWVRSGARVANPSHNPKRLEHGGMNGQSLGTMGGRGGGMGTRHTNPSSTSVSNLAGGMAAGGLASHASTANIPRLTHVPSSTGISVQYSSQGGAVGTPYSYSSPRRGKMHTHGAPRTASPSKKKGFSFFNLVGGAAKDDKSANMQRDSALIILCLRTLGSLTLPGVSLVELVQGSVLPYLTDDDERVRKEAAVTCAKMIATTMVKSSPSLTPSKSEMAIWPKLDRHAPKRRLGSSEDLVVLGNTNSSINLAHTHENMCRSHENMQRSGELTARSTESVMSPRPRGESVYRPPLPGLPKTQIYTKGPTAVALDMIYRRLLEMIVVDKSSSVRLAALECLVLSTQFDRYLSRSHHIEMLLFLLSDERFEIRLDALSLLGRLASMNPAAILAPMRLQLIQVISAIKNSADNRLREEAILLLCRFLRAPTLQSIVKPYVGQLISILPLHSEVRLTTAALESIAEICKVMRQDIAPFSDQLIPVIISNMYDHSSRRKQEMAIRTLGQLVGATGLVVKPYLQYPQLLPKALDLLSKSRTAMPWTLREEMLRTIGLLGALEPQRFSLIVSYLQELEKAKSEKGFPESETRSNLLNDTISRGVVNPMRTTFYDRDRADSQLSLHTVLTKPESDKGTESGPSHTRSGSVMSWNGGDTNDGGGDDLIRTDRLLLEEGEDLPAHLFMYSQCVMRSLSEPTIKEIPRKTPHSEDYFPRVALTALMKMLRDRSLAVHHSSVAQAIMQIFRSIGMMKCVPFLDEIVPFLLQVVRHCGPGLRESLLQQLSQMVSIVQYHITSYLPTIFDIVKDYWEEHLEHILSLVEEIAVTATDAFTSPGYMDIILPLLLSSLAVPRGLTASSFKGQVPRQPTPSQALKPLEQTLSCVNALRVILVPHLHLVVPALCKLVDQLQTIAGMKTEHWQHSTVRAIRHLCTRRGSLCSVADQSNGIIGRVVHTLTRTIVMAYESDLQIPPDAPIFNECILTLCAVGHQMGPRFFLTFDNLIFQSIDGKGLNIAPYLTLASALQNGTLMEFNYNDCDNFVEPDAPGLPTRYGGGAGAMENNVAGMGSYYSFFQSTNGYGGMSTLGAAPSRLFRGDSVDGMTQNNMQSMNNTSGLPRLPVNQHQLSRAWDVSQRSTGADWAEWFRRLKGDLLRYVSVDAHE
jgi:hypothetical protein